MSRVVGKLVRAGECFLIGFGQQMADGGTLAIATAVGFQQGLKYKGNLKTGLVAGGVTLAVLSSIQGVRMVFHNIEYINQPDVIVVKCSTK